LFSSISSPNGEATRPRIFYGWVIVGLSFVTLAFHITARFSFAILQVPLIAEFGWGRGALGGAYALGMGIYALTNPLIGSLFEKYGPRAVMPWGSVLVGLGLTGGFFISSLWHVYFLTGVLIAFGTSLSGFSMHGALMPRWFQKRRGLATGIIFSGIGIGALLLSPIIERLIANFGWRAAYLFYGLAVILILIPAKFLLLRNQAQDVGQALDGLSSGTACNPAAPAGHTEAALGVSKVFRIIRGERHFWMLAAITFVIGLCNNTILSQLLLYFVDVKYGMAVAAIILGMAGFFRIGGSVVTGWLSDHLGRQHAMALAAVTTALGVLLLLLIPVFGVAPVPGYVFAVIFGFGTGGMSTCFSAMTADAFKGSSLATVMGILEIFYGAGGVIGPPLAGYAFDFMGSYTMPFSVIGLSVLAVVFLTIFSFHPERVPEIQSE
jgi:MFS family permease